MARFAAVRDALAAALAAAVPDDLAVYPHTPDQVAAPAVVVTPADPFADYQVRMGGATTAVYRLDVTFLCGRAAEQAAQTRLDEWAAPDGPVLPALYGSGLADTDAEVLSVQGRQYGVFRVGQGEYLGFSLAVEIEA